MARFPTHRMRRMRTSEPIRTLVRETWLRPGQLVMPLFVRPGRDVLLEIPSMPGNYQMSIDRLVEKTLELESLGLGAVLLFGIPELKDARASHSAAKNGIVQRAIRAVKKACERIPVVTDVCLCAYMDHGHCGVVVKERGDRFRIDNDKTLDLLATMAISHAEAGADIVAPSDMMDGRVAAIRHGLDQHGFIHLPIMSYAAKYASCFYGPFRDAAESAPQFGDRRTYQMDPANAEEALREVELDVQEGADIVMVKPALPYLDVLQRVKQQTGITTAAYCVSGEFAMVKAAAEKGWIDEQAAVMEILTSIRRAGADIIITYWAEQAARLLAGAPPSTSAGGAAVDLEGAAADNPDDGEEIPQE